MTQRIPQSFINTLLDQTNIIDIVNQRIILKKTGNNYLTNCPFHHDKTPSFTINKAKQFYHCFGCHAHGNVIDFLMHYEHLTFLETIEELAILHGLDIPNTKLSISTQNEYLQKKNLYFLMKKISTMYVNNLLKSIGKVAYNYLIQRGLNNNIIHLFSIGYSIQQIEYSSIFQTKHLNANVKELVKIGFIGLNEHNQMYDRFRNRIMFPIKDHHGRITGFGGRNICNKNPKYLNSKESIIFKKRNQLYGLYEVKKTNSKIDKIIVVEGYIDVLMLFKFHINYAVATLGTFITIEHIQILFRTTNNIIYCFDGDSAGRLAAWRTLKLSLPYIYDNKNFKFIFLPEGEDPDTIIQKEGTIGFEKRIESSIPFSDFLFDKLLKNANLSCFEDKIRLSGIIIPLINKIPGNTIRFFLKKMLSQKIGIISEFQFEKLFLKPNGTTIKNKIFDFKHTTIRILISLLVQNPRLVNNIPNISNISHLKISGLSFFLELINICNQNTNLNTGSLIELYRYSKRADIIKKIAKWDNMISHNSIKSVFLDALTQLCNKGLEARQEFLISKERKQGINKIEKIELWNINKELVKS